MIFRTKVKNNIQIPIAVLKYESTIDVINLYLAFIIRNLFFYST
jgi:hypothetical protein